MAFLAINGYEIPVSISNSPDYENEIIGEKYGSYSGMVISSIQNYRKRWRVTTVPMGLAEAHSLRNLIAGKGHNWKFDDSLYSGKNLVGTFTRATTRYLQDGTNVTSGNPGYETGPNSSANSSDKGVTIEVGCVPLMGADTFLEHDAGGGLADSYSSYSTGTGAGTHSIDAGTTGFGRAASQKIVKNDGGADRFGIRNTALMTGVSQPNTCQFLVHVSALSGGASVVLQADYYTAADAYVETQSTSISATTSDFTKYELPATTDATAAKCYLYVWIQGNDGTVYVQAIGSENQAFGTTWADGNRNDETLYLDATIFNRRNFTLGFWFKPIDEQVVSNKYGSLFETYIDSDNYWQMIVAPDGKPYFAVKGRGSETNTYNSSDSALTKDTWYFLAAHGDGTSFTMTVNGVESTKGETGFGYRVPYGAITNLYLGSNASGVSQACGIYSDLLVLPYRMSTAQLLAYYNLSRPFYDTPRLELYGTYVNRSASNPIIVEGIFNSRTCVQRADGLKYQLQFELVEVI